MNQTEPEPRDRTQMEQNLDHMQDNLDNYSALIARLGRVLDRFKGASEKDGDDEIKEREQRDGAIGSFMTKNEDFENWNNEMGIKLQELEDLV